MDWFNIIIKFATLVKFFLFFMLTIIVWLYILPNSWTNTYTTDDKFRLASIISIILAIIFVAVQKNV